MTKHILALLLCICAFAPRDAAALSYVMMQDDTLLGQAEGVALFEVTSVSPVPAREETRYALRPIARFSGAVLAPVESLVLPGYVVKGEQLVFPGVPRLTAGQRVLVFHKRRDDGVLQAMQLTLGLFFPMSTARGEVYVRALDEGNDLSQGKNARYAQVRDARGFERWIRRRAAGLDAAPDYLVGASGATEKFHLTQLNLAGTPLPARWFQFDEGITMQWRAPASGQMGTSLDEFVMLEQALAGWTSEPGSLIRMAYAGTGVSSSPNDANVTWNDPGDQIPGDFTCPGGGILGSGGSLASTPSRSFGGDAWYQRSQGRLRTQPGTGCFFEGFGATSGIEFFVHEIGHALGFAHSCGPDSPTTSCAAGSAADEATMRFSLHVDGRGATLQPDDIAAARFVYPDSTPAPTANLSLSIDASPALVPIGETITYDIAVSNAGPDAAASLVVTVEFPPATELGGSSGAGWSCNGSGNTVTCTRPTLASGVSAAIEVLADVPLDYEGPNALVGEASVASATDDPNGANNSDTVITALDPIVGRIFGNSFE